MPKPAPSHMPESMHTVTPHMWFNGNCMEAIEFYKKAFNAEMPAPATMWPDGKRVMHGMIKIGDSNFMMADAMPEGIEKGPEGHTTVGFWLYVEDVDASFKQAVEAGCEVMYDVMDAFWGDRTGKVSDPYGHTWAIATWKYEMTPEEMEAGQKAWLEAPHN